MITDNTSITGVLVTGKTPKRYPLARKAVESWLGQDYTGDRELLIINDHPTQSLYPTDIPAGVIEYRVAPGSTLGELRNLGIKYAHYDYIVQWDDDDYSDRNRLTYQVENTDPSCASIFRWEIHCNLKTGAAFANCGDEIRCGGFPGTMLWPRTAVARFNAKGKAEDTEFIIDLKKELPVKVINNPPSLYFRCYHGNNTWSEKHVMKRKRNSRDLNTQEYKYVEERLRTYTAIREKLNVEVSE